MNKYFGGFSCAEDVENQWSGADLNGATVIAATYDAGDYDGSAMIVFIKEGKYYEVHCSHCSCNGLDDWSPEETTYEALMDRFEKTEEQMSDGYGVEFTQAVRRGLMDEMFDREVLEN